ncbi:MAG: TIGR04282 family arsenosugar biosynthesis glycosyltransferase [Proteobacteria bacterium]|nr:TIGR04282 family arsenosugar biosynthesis glycosyltransferase [Pseudomonadota bacterium]
MKDTAIVFARVPRLGTVKRRLAREIGPRAAVRFHAATLNRLLRALAADRTFRTVVAATPDRAWVRLPPGVGRISQGGGDLGARMSRALDRFQRGRAVLIGCDIPEAGAADIRAGFAALRRAEAVFGPAADGGYWLVGMGPYRPARPFAGVRWSSRNALADTLRNFTGRRLLCLRPLSDVDTAEDWRSLPPRWRG